MHCWTQTLSLPLFSVEVDADSDGANVRVKRSKNEQNTTSIRQIAKIALRHATRIQKFPEGNRLFIKRKWRGQFENSRKVCRGVGKTSQEVCSNGWIRPIIQVAAFNFCSNPLMFLATIMCEDVCEKDRHPSLDAKPYLPETSQLPHWNKRYYNLVYDLTIKKNLSEITEGPPRTN